MKNKEIENGLEEIGILRNEIDKLEFKTDSLVKMIVHKDFPEINLHNIYCPFILECEKSPFGWCVYNLDKKRHTCLYCHGRKTES